MRVLQVVHGFPPEASGGGDLYASRLARALATRAEVRVVAGTARDGVPEGRRIDEEVDGLPVTRIQRTFRAERWSDPWRSDACAATFREVLAGWRPDVVHFHHLTNLDLGLPVLARAAGARVVYTLHDYWLACQRGQLVDRDLRPCPGPTPTRCATCWPGPGGPPWPRRWIGFHGRRRLLRRSLESVDLLVAPARRIAGWFEGVLAAEGIRTRIVVEGYGMPPLDVTAGSGTGKEDRRSARLGFLGTMMFTKGVHVLLEALVARPAWNLEVHCHGGVSAYHEIGGYGEYLEELRARYPDTVRLHGPYEPSELPRILAGLDAVCCPSIWPENSPLVVHEALQAGIPVLGSDRGGIPELVCEGRDGFLRSPEDVGAWSELLGRIDDDPDLLRRLPVSAAAVGSLEPHADRIVGLYRGLVGRPSPRSRDVESNGG